LKENLSTIYAHVNLKAPKIKAIDPSNVKYLLGRPTFNPYVLY